MYCRMGLLRFLDGKMPSSNEITGGVLYPAGNVCCSVSTTERIFQARSVAARTSALFVK
ncbi:hypothetical protein PHMEG_00011780 [Phytophthora megakarya]|uniref:Uncharacterized protein n=1 Tax=Phytophthora megakarya TaxID=4795 RepID=A0A225WAW6_9STRA|nr:hypothetical protein PHMEG_00011780 [Phytophthora megakarya]